MKYLFGDNERAAQRLELLARVFKGSTCSFVHDQLLAHPLRHDPRVIDLGCGPGCTTRLLADLCGSPVIGLDNSDVFLWEARRLNPHRVSFRHHDVSKTPLAAAPADLMFARLVLCHLQDPEAIARSWWSQLEPGGRLMVEEVDSIDSRDEVFTAYLTIVEDALRHQQTELYIGAALAALDGGHGVETASSTVTRVAVTNSDAAMMFSLNLPTLRQSDAVRETVDETTLDELQNDLDLRAYTRDGVSDITWHLRQITWRRQA